MFCWTGISCWTGAVPVVSAFCCASVRGAGLHRPKPLPVIGPAPLGPVASNPGIVNHIQEVEVLHLQLLLICALIHKLCLSGKDGWQCFPGTWSSNRSGKGEKVRARTGVFFSPRTARIRCILQGRSIPPARWFFSPVPVPATALLRTWSPDNDHHL